MFFFDQQTQEDIRSRKKRRRLEDSRQDRIRQLEADEELATGGEDDGGEVRSLTAFLQPCATTARFGPDSLS